ncbi:MAG TPA: RluA family pseudouridine synthase [Ktedonobacterales bacterium]
MTTTTAPHDPAGPSRAAQPTVGAPGGRPVGSDGCPLPGPDAPPPTIVVLYEDDHLLAVVKPAGMVTHPTYKHPDGTLTDLIFARQAARGERRPWLLHRLDRETSGVVLFAKTEAARRGVVRQFERRTVGKQYLAVTAGVPPQHQGVIEAALARDPADRRRTIVVAAESGQLAATRYTVLAVAAPRGEGTENAEDAEDTRRTRRRGARFTGESAEAEREISPSGRRSPARAGKTPAAGTLVGADASAGPLASLILAEPLTGRTHQIRAHLASVGAPLAGDTRYLPDDAAGHAMASRALLHAWRLTITSPATGGPLTLVAPVPADLRAAALALGLGALDTLPVPNDFSPASPDFASFALPVPSPETPTPT